MNPWRSAFGRSARGIAIVAGAIACLWRPSPLWVETAFANGFYPRLEHALLPITNALPWSLGDLAIACGVALLVWRLTVTLRSRRWLVALLDVVAILGLYLFWFEAAWGWNYLRAPL